MKWPILAMLVLSSCASKTPIALAATGLVTGVFSGIGQKYMDGAAHEKERKRIIFERKFTNAQGSTAYALKRCLELSEKSERKIDLLLKYLLSTGVICEPERPGQ